MGFCPVPHTFRDQVWIGVGILGGIGVYKLVSTLMSTPPPSKPSSPVRKPEGPVTLHYFQGRGRAECVRWMLAAAGIPFEQPLYETNKQFEDMKGTGSLLFNQFPMLEIEGMQLTQSRAIVSHIARISGLYGTSAAEATRCDMVVHAVADFESGPMGYPFAEDKHQRRIEMQELVNKWCPFFEKIVADNGHFAHAVGATLTVADIRLAEVLTGYLELLPRCLEKFPQLAALQCGVAARGSIKSYLASPQRKRLPNDEVCTVYAKNVYSVLGREWPPASWGN